LSAILRGRACQARRKSAGSPSAGSRVQAATPALNLYRKRRPTSPHRRLPPLASHKRPVPAQQRPWSDQPGVAQRPWQLAGCRREQRTISRTQLRPRHLTAQHLELVPQHDQLDVLHVQATATANERAQQSPEREVDEGKNHAADPPRPYQSSATRLLAPLRRAAVRSARVREHLVAAAGSPTVIAQ